MSEKAFSPLSLNREFTLFFSEPEDLASVRRHRDKYDENIKEVASFNTVQDFWFYYSHMTRPAELPNKASFAFFQEGIRPMWEDSGNSNGSRFMLRVKKEYANRIWEDLIIAFLGDTCKVLKLKK
jgi:hypothetical protein